MERARIVFKLEDSYMQANDTKDGLFHSERVAVLPDHGSCMKTLITHWIRRLLLAQAS